MPALEEETNGGSGFGSAFGSYRAYEYTDSVAFCGTLCHGVMQPEYAAYQNSPHAREDSPG